MIKEYKFEESIERNKELKQLLNHTKNQRENNLGERELHSLSYKIQYIGLDILREYNYSDEDPTSSQLAKRHGLGEMFGL